MGDPGAEIARDEAERKRLAELAAAAQALVDAGVTVRDAGRVLETSHQRVAQLTDRPGRARVAAALVRP
ncbi:hypothetical protein [Marinactinospora rubrisoli]|uniref:Uncharacterized protein n=1 Tax=Marinactinospora rubrisoli TaxID=2715399 RepID=A0ABW2KCK1_9ACTN